MFRFNHSKTVNTNNNRFENYLLCGHGHIHLRGHTAYTLMYANFFVLLYLWSTHGVFFHYYYCLFLVSLRQSIWHTTNSRRLTPNNNNTAANASSSAGIIFEQWSATTSHLLFFFFRINTFCASCIVIEFFPHVLKPRVKKVGRLVNICGRLIGKITMTRHYSCSIRDGLLIKKKFDEILQKPLAILFIPILHTSPPSVIDKKIIDKYYVR